MFLYKSARKEHRAAADGVQLLKGRFIVTIGQFDFPNVLFWRLSEPEELRLQQRAVKENYAYLLAAFSVWKTFFLSF